MQDRPKTDDRAAADDGTGADDGGAIAAVLDFWFGEIEPAAWFRADDALDRRIADRFAGLHARLAAVPGPPPRPLTGLPPAWYADGPACLATVVVLDQFPRNLFRGSPRAYGTDDLALAATRHAIARGWDDALPPPRRTILYMPFQHVEDPAVQAEGMAVFEKLGNATVLDHARQHKAVIDRFGRFPHRNRALGRPSTPAETAWLDSPGGPDFQKTQGAAAPDRRDRPGPGQPGPGQSDPGQPGPGLLR